MKLLLNLRQKPKSNFPTPCTQLSSLFPGTEPVLQERHRREQMIFPCLPGSGGREAWSGGGGELGTHPGW